MAKILIIEDSSSDEKRFREMCESEGHSVVSAVHGQEGLDKFKEDPADVVITELLLPDKEGYQAIAELRQNHPDLKIIALGGRENPGGGDSLESAKLMGADFSLVRPLTKEALLNAVTEALAQGGKMPTHPGKAGGKETGDGEGAASKKKIPPILIVEDSKTTQKIYEIFISSNKNLKNIPIKKSLSGEEGLRIMKETEVSLIVLDWNLPKMSGVQFAREIRSNPKWKQIPIIMASTVTDKTRILEAISYGINDYLIKPVLKHVFIDKIKTHLAGYFAEG